MQPPITMATLVSLTSSTKAMEPYADSPVAKAGRILLTAIVTLLNVMFFINTF